MEMSRTLNGAAAYRPRSIPTSQFRLHLSSPEESMLNWDATRDQNWDLSLRQDFFVSEPGPKLGPKLGPDSGPAGVRARVMLDRTAPADW